MRKIRKGEIMVAKVFSSQKDGNWYRSDGPRKKYKDYYYIDDRGDCQKAVVKELGRLLGYSSSFCWRHVWLTKDLYLIIVKVVEKSARCEALTELGFKKYQYDEAFA